ncbi:unnamed protein product [Cercopithifilaria johnstoni]|uniref:DUF3719 domain-containing protein n=1 Tax=Cercopithifilaria johnstoni TaxID=2874296 RepID=A0A8J2LV14_9BILA|nr:unnamed protein product [Cercopithifilaria johnstoni]
MQNYRFFNEAKTKEHFLIRAERSIYEGEPMSDDEVEAECRLWAHTLPHLRICGKSISKSRNGEMKKDKIDWLEHNLLYDPVSDVLNKKLQRKKLQPDTLVKKMPKEKIKMQKHFTLPSIFNGHQNHLSHPNNVCLK